MFTHWVSLVPLMIWLMQGPLEEIGDSSSRMATTTANPVGSMRELRPALHLRERADRLSEQLGSATRVNTKRCR